MLFLSQYWHSWQYWKTSTCTIGIEYAVAYANLQHFVANFHSYLLSEISIFQILYLILASFKGPFILLLRFEYTTYRNYKEKSGGIISLQTWLMQICGILPLLVAKRFIL